MSGISPAINLLGSGEDLPGDPCDLVRECDDNLVAVHALFELRNPCFQRMTLPVAGLHAGSGSMDQDPSKISVTSFTDAEQSGLATGGILSWRESKPSSKEPPVRELMTVAG